MESLDNQVRATRERLGMSQRALAEAVELSRQALFAIESGRSVPSVAVALRLSRALSCQVEDLFRSESPVDSVRVETDPEGVALDGRVRLARVSGRWVVHPLGGQGEGALRSADGAIVGPGGDGHLDVELLRPRADAEDTLLLSGCAPALAVLADRLNTRGGPGRFVWLQRTSGAALSLLGRGRTHVGGVHASGVDPDAANLALVRRALPDAPVALVGLVAWTEGLIVARGNPLGLRTAADLARPGVRIATRAPGASARRLLDRALAEAGHDPAALLAGARVAEGHLDVARAVALGAADAGVAIEPVAAAYGLDFLPWARERFDLVLPAGLDADPRVARLLDTLTSASFRRDLALIGGYDPSVAGRVVAEVAA